MFEAKFELKENTMPIFKKKRNVPFASVEKINEELDSLEKMGIISKVESNSWAAPIVCIKKKSNQVRICVDFSTGLNSVIKDYHYPLPSPEEIFNKLNGGVIFSKIDLSDAYLQIPVEEECSKLLGINTHRGLFKYNRLPFGIKVAPAIFQQAMDVMLNDLDFACAYLDDIIVRSETVDEHREHLNQVFKKIQDFGFKVKESKCEFVLEEIKLNLIPGLRQ